MTSSRLIHNPTALNLGSGKDFRADYFNIDVDETWTPDVVLDLSAVTLDEHGIALSTERFGPTAILPNSVEKIIANDVLEHVPDLVALMTTCLGILKPGGVFEISVPYDLSFGAWQDPTHVRAFNERSWLYYTDWFWYLGWRDARFVTDVMNLVPSSIGQAQLAKGMPQDEIIRMPRAIDSMSVTLRKTLLSPEDLATVAHWRDRRAAAKDNMRLPVSSTGPAGTPPPVAFADGWAAHRDRHCIWIVTPEGYEHVRAVEEVAEALSAAFAELGGSAPVVRQPADWAGRAPIILGSQLLAPLKELALPVGTILFNLEQVDGSSSWMNAPYLAMLRRHAVLDYSEANIAALRAKGITHVKHLPIGYAPSLTRIAPAPVRDIDVLFCGSLNERRIAIIESLRARGLAVVHLFGVYGAARDAVIARAKIVLNMHFYEAAVFEIVRVSYLLANGVCVVSEGRDDDQEAAPYRDGLYLCPYESIVARCVDLLADDASRDATAARGLAIMRGRTQADALKAAFA